MTSRILLAITIIATAAQAARRIIEGDFPDAMIYVGAVALFCVIVHKIGRAARSRQ